MKIVYGKALSDNQLNTIKNISSACGILEDTARLLYYRDVDSVQKAKRFLCPSKQGFHNPFLLNGMREAVNRIVKAKENGESVLIFGDYDADGVCATSVLYFCLKEFGIDARCIVPEREDGYGLNLDTIERLNLDKKIDLLITVDCGISDFDKIKELKEKGVDVIVTDHHEPPEILPNTICINPKIAGQDYPFDGLCGAGVAYKLGRALIDERADDYLDVVALATVADSMDLIDENRDIVAEGLKIFNSENIRLPFKHLLGDGVNRNVTAQTLAYTIAPRVNAGGRMGDANTALKLFLSKDSKSSFELSVKLNEYNIARQVECDNIYKEASKKIKETGVQNDTVIMVADEKWKTGFIGIVAAKLVEDYARPVIVFAGHDGYYKGSARSVDGVNIHDALTSVKDLLIGYGGHSQAAGVSVEKEKFEQLKNALCAYVNSLSATIEVEQKIYAEWVIESEFSLRFAREIELLEPFGVGNRRPLFAFNTDKIIDSLPIKAGSPHFGYKTDAIEMLDFNGESNVRLLSLPVKKNILFEINLSTYKNRQFLKGYVRKVFADYGDFSGLSLYNFSSQLNTILLGGEKIALPINAKDVGKFLNKNTLFVVSDVNNLYNYPMLNALPVDLYKKSGKGTTDSIVVCAEKIDNGFSAVVYLDTPIKVLETDVKSYFVPEFNGYRIIDTISTDREVFKDNFNRLVALNGKTFKNVSEFCMKNLSGENLYQYVFAISVFVELGIFSIENGYFSYNSQVKNPLTNSKVYSKIYTLKGLYD